MVFLCLHIALHLHHHRRGPHPHPHLLLMLLRSLPCLFCVVALHHLHIRWMKRHFHLPHCLEIPLPHCLEHHLHHPPCMELHLQLSHCLELHLHLHLHSCVEHHLHLPLLRCMEPDLHPLHCLLVHLLNVEHHHRLLPLSVGPLLHLHHLLPCMDHQLHHPLLEAVYWVRQDLQVWDLPRLLP